MAPPRLDDRARRGLPWGRVARIVGVAERRIAPSAVDGGELGSISVQEGAPGDAVRTEDAKTHREDRIGRRAP